MPLYEYRCPDCGYMLEEFASVEDRDRGPLCFHSTPTVQLRPANRPAKTRRIIGNQFWKVGLNGQIQGNGSPIGQDHSIGKDMRGTKFYPPSELKSGKASGKRW